MHRSQLAGIIIDCKTADLDEAGEFWSKALGYEIKPSDHPQDENYVLLQTPDDEIDIEIQKVDHESRMHIDIETDDIEAEASRLEKLGAKRVKIVADWLVMQAPTGQRFCLVLADPTKHKRSRFKSKANHWQ